MSTKNGDIQLSESEPGLGSSSDIHADLQEQPNTTPSTTSTSHDPTASQPQTCANCPLLLTPSTSKSCPRCHTTAYCSRSCLKADFKKHKKGCAELAQKYAESADIKMATRSVPKKEGHRGGLQKWQFDT